MQREDAVDDEPEEQAARDAGRDRDERVTAREEMAGTGAEDRRPRRPGGRRERGERGEARPREGGGTGGQGDGDAAARDEAGREEEGRATSRERLAGPADGGLRGAWTSCASCAHADPSTAASPSSMYT